MRSSRVSSAVKEEFFCRHWIRSRLTRLSLLDGGFPLSVSEYAELEASQSKRDASGSTVKGVSLALWKCATLRSKMICVTADGSVMRVHFLACLGGRPSDGISTWVTREDWDGLRM